MRFENKQLVTREVDARSERLNDLEQQLGLCAADTARIKKLVNELKDGGTGDARRAVQSSVSEAKDTIRSRFDAEHDETKREQAEAQQLEQDVQEEARSDAGNAAEINKAHADLHADEAKEPLDQAAAELRYEADALEAEADRMQDRREQSLREAERLLRQVRQELA
ncbi:MAG: hypothetical protein ACE37H_08015 [Phycisphaeraceae bacterium]